MDERDREPELFEIEFDPFIATLARIFAGRANPNPSAVSVLVEGTACCDYVGTGLTHWSDREIALFEVRLIVPQSVFNAVVDGLLLLEKELHKKAELLMRSYPTARLEGFRITPEEINNPEWRTDAKAYLRGEGINNQGRVRSDNIAPHTKDGLLFRSKPEIYLYDALKSRGITFAPLPVFIRGGDDYQRSEPDFFLVQGGKCFVIHLDGPFHTESPVEAHERSTMFSWQGAVIERVPVSECDSPEKAQRIATQIEGVIRRHLTNK